MRGARGARPGLVVVIVGAAILGFGVLAESHPHEAALILVFPVVMAVAYYRPREALSVSLPLFALNIAIIGSVSLKLALAATAGLTWAIGLARRRWQLRRLGHGLLFGFALLLTVSLYTSPSADFAARQSDFRGLVAGVLLAAAAMSIGLLPELAMTSTAIGIGAIATASTFGLVNGGHGLNEARASGLGLNANFLGVVFATGLIAAFGMLLRGRGPGNRVIAGLAAAMCLVALFSTASRGALLVGAVGVGAILFRAVSRRSHPAIALVLIGIVLALGLHSRTSVDRLALGGRDITDFSLSNTLRGEAASLSFHYIERSPFTGIGYGLFAERSSADTRIGAQLNTHDDYLRLAAEAGLPTLLVFGALLGLAIARRKAMPPVLGAVLIGGAVALLTTNALSNLQVSAPLWLVLGYAWWLDSGTSSGVENPIPHDGVGAHAQPLLIGRTAGRSPSSPRASVQQQRSGSATQ